MIKFLDLHKINIQYDKELKDVANRVISSGWYLMGKELENFEQRYASFCGVKFALGVANGLDALRLIFKAYSSKAEVETNRERSLVRRPSEKSGNLSKRSLVNTS